jgi:RNase P subunit RPR2
VAVRPVAASERNMEKYTNGHERPCSNCNKPTKLSQAVTTYASNKLVSVICPACQQAKKIQITLKRNKSGWVFDQYFPVES